MAAMQMLGDDEGDEVPSAVPLSDPGLDLRLAAGAVAIAAIDDLPLICPDRVVLAVDLDVPLEGLEGRLPAPGRWPRPRDIPTSFLRCRSSSALLHLRSIFRLVRRMA